MTERVGPIQDKGKQKVSEKYEPDSESFRKMMQIGEAPETDLDEQSARKQPIQEEEEPEETTPTSSDIYYYEKQSEGAPLESQKGQEAQMKGKSSPESPEFYAQLKKKKLTPEIEKMGYIVDKELKAEKAHLPPTEGKKEVKPREKAVQLPFEPKLGHERVSKEAEMLEKAELHAKIEPEKPELKKPTVEKGKKTDTGKAEAEKSLIREKEKAALRAKKEKHHVEKKEKKEELTVSPYQTLDLSEATRAEAAAIAGRLESNLNPEVVPILEHMIGALIQFTDKGISETQIILNNKKFENSRFYNSKIIFEKYATAPHSYNIKLTGSQEAVTIFNENIEGLYKKLTQSGLEFEIGQLTAEYERPLFKRKEAVEREKKSR